MMFSRTQLKSRGEIPSPCLTPVLISKGSERQFKNFIFDIVPVNVALIIANSFRSTPNSLRMFSRASRSIEPYAFFYINGNIFEVFREGPRGFSLLEAFLVLV